MPHQSRASWHPSSRARWSNRIRGFLERHTDLAFNGARSYPRVTRDLDFSREELRNAHTVLAPIPELADTRISTYPGGRYVNEAAASFLESLHPLSLIEHGESECAICMETLSDTLLGSQAVRLPCSHVFGHDCIVQWVDSSASRPKNTCPICRAPLFEIRTARRNWQEMLADVREAVDHLEALQRVTQRLYAYERHNMYTDIIQESSLRVQAVRNAGLGWQGFDDPPTVTQLLMAFLELNARPTRAPLEDVQALSRMIGAANQRLGPALRSLGVEDASGGWESTIAVLLDPAWKERVEERFGYFLTAEVMMEWGR